jgi:hypothetical protein
MTGTRKPSAPVKQAHCHTTPKLLPQRKRNLQSGINPLHKRPRYHGLELYDIDDDEEDDEEEDEVEDEEEEGPVYRQPAKVEKIKGGRRGVYPIEREVYPGVPRYGGYGPQFVIAPRTDRVMEKKVFITVKRAKLIEIFVE